SWRASVTCDVGWPGGISPRRIASRSLSWTTATFCPSLVFRSVGIVEPPGDRLSNLHPNLELDTVVAVVAYSNLCRCGSHESNIERRTARRRESPSRGGTAGRTF